MRLAGKFDPLLARGKAALTNAAMNPALSTLGVMNVIQGEDPERYGSSNTLMARTATPTLQYT